MSAALRVFDPVQLSVFGSRLEAACEEMGAVLARSAFSPNIKDRLDFSCALFDAAGELVAQAAHIPVHLGSMAFAMRDIVGAVHWAPGDMVVLNDPFLGGTHLPDITLIAPLFVDGHVVAFVANRAHHASIGASSPGSMPLSRSLEEEGMVIPPTHLLRAGEVQMTLLRRLAGDAGDADFQAQISANRVGLARLRALLDTLGSERVAAGMAQLNDYAEQLALAELAGLPAGHARAEDWMDDDGLGGVDLPLRVNLTLGSEGLHADFTGTSPQAQGNINCPLSVTAAALYYVFRCLMPAHAPACAGLFRPLRITAPEGCLVNARRPAAVAAGNVETSMRLVDVIIAALAALLPERVCAAAHGSMNNIAMGVAGADAWDYYETMGGGLGGSPAGPGPGGVQAHMTNTRNTPVESLEMHHPLRVTRYALRHGSGGAGRHRGGDGLVREFQFLAPARVTLLTERRRRGPWGLAGGAAGQPGANHHNGQSLPGKVALTVATGDRISVASAGGGGWGKPE